MRLRSRASGSQDLVGVDGQLLEHLVLVGEQVEHLVGLLQRRGGAADDVVEVLAAAGQADAELVEDQASGAGGPAGG